MKIIISGATGLIGSALVKRLSGRHELVVFSRDVPHARKVFGGGTGIHFADWHQPPSHLAALIDGSRALINLAGESIGQSRWTPTRKRALLWSRVQTTGMLHALLKASEIKLDTIIQTSAIGYYGNSNTETFDEESPSGSGFLAEVTQKWEASATPLAEVCQRSVIVRSGLVLASNGGALPKMTLPYRLFMGGKVGSGMQWISWIDIEDETEAILFLLRNARCQGVYNLVSPNPVRQSEFSVSLSKTLHRPSFVHIPKSLVRLVTGEMGEELLLQGARVMPKRLLEAGYRFQYPMLDESLRSNLG